MPRSWARYRKLSDLSVEIELIEAGGRRRTCRSDRLNVVGVEGISIGLSRADQLGPPRSSGHREETPNALCRTVR